MFELAPSSGERTYAWDKKVTLAMSCSEIANILDNPNREWSFYHDPSEYLGCCCHRLLPASETVRSSWAPYHVNFQLAVASFHL